MNDVHIDLGRLRMDVDRLLQLIAAHQGESTPLSSDYFWSIQDARVTDENLDNPNPTIGQVSETLEFLDVDRERWDGVDLSALGAPLRWTASLLAIVAAEVEHRDTPN